MEKPQRDSFGGKKPVFDEVVYEVDAQQNPDGFEPAGFVNQRLRGGRAVTAFHKSGDGHGKCHQQKQKCHKRHGSDK